MPTKHDPPRPSAGETTRSGRPARKSGTGGRQKAVDPAKLRVVAEMMAGGFDYVEMQQVLAERWGCSERTIRAYRARVLTSMREELQDAGFMDPGLETVLGVRRLEEVYLAAMKEHDYRSAANIIKTRLQLVGVLGPKQHEHRHHFETPLVAAVVETKTPGEAATEARRALTKRLAELAVKRKPVASSAT